MYTHTHGGGCRRYVPNNIHFRRNRGVKRNEWNCFTLRNLTEKVTCSCLWSFCPPKAAACLQATNMHSHMCIKPLMRLFISFLPALAPSVVELEPLDLFLTNETCFDLSSDPITNSPRGPMGSHILAMSFCLCPYRIDQIADPCVRSSAVMCGSPGM